MPTFVATPGIIRAAVRGVLAANPIVNIFHMGDPTFSGPYSQAQLDTLAGQVAGAYQIAFQAIIANGWSLQQVTTTDLSNEFGLTGSSSTSYNGTDGTVMYPAAFAQGLTWHILRRYRGGHPRTYLPPPGSATALLNQTTFSSARLSALQGAATSFLGQINGLTIAGRGVGLYCVHKTRAGAALVPHLVDVITSGTADSRPDSQRRRLGRDR